MKRIKRFASLLLALALAFSLAGCFAQDAVITRGEAAKLLLTAADDYCPDLKTEDILKGYPDGTLEEDGPLTYAQALIMIDRAFGGLPVPIGDSARTAAGAQGFADTPAWAEKSFRARAGKRHRDGRGRRPDASRKAADEAGVPDASCESLRA